MRISNIRRGNLFEFNGHRFLLISKLQGLCTLIDTRPLHLPFLKNTDMPSADYSQSNIATYLRKDYLNTMLSGKDGKIFSELLCTMKMKLSATNTSMGYGRYTTKVGILTLSQYIRNHDLMVKAGITGWLATPVYPPVITKNTALLSQLWRVGSDFIPKISEADESIDCTHPMITMQVSSDLCNMKVGRLS